MLEGAVVPCRVGAKGAQNFVDNTHAYPATPTTGTLTHSRSTPARAISTGSGTDERACPHHGGLCAYDAASPTRCPWCHTPWGLMLDPTAWHSCEQSGLWPRADRRWRVARARQMRAQATQAVDEAASASAAAALPRQSLEAAQSTSRPLSVPA
jgi:hypothetical protein